MRDSQSRKDYLVYWGNKHSLNKDKFFSHLEERNSIGEKHSYRRRVVKEEWSMKSEEDGFKKDGKTKKHKRVKDEKNRIYLVFFGRFLFYCFCKSFRERVTRQLF